MPERMARIKPAFTLTSDERQAAGPLPALALSGVAPHDNF